MMIFKKKPIYIVGIAVFTLLLIADLLIYFLVPAAGSGQQQSGSFGGSFSGNFGGDFSGQLPEDFGGQLPEDFDPENMGGFGGQMPDFGGADGEGTTGQRPESFQNFGGAQRPGRESEGTENGFLQTVRAGFWVILIVCLLGDSVCIFMLIRVSRKNTEEATPQAEEREETTARYDKTNIWLGVIAAVLVVALLLSSFSSGADSIRLQARVSVEQATAGLRDMVSTYSGSGTLAGSDPLEIETPLTVSVTSYMVKNGEAVEAGDILAAVDKNSVLRAIYQVQALLKEMDEELAEVQGDVLESKVTARADGRIKAIYATQGESVAQVMYEKEALIVLSLGGSMTVEIESDDALAVGQSLTVTLSNGTTTEGKVQQVRDGIITVTTTDNGPEPEDTVSVATQDGTLLGTGILHISSPMKVTGYYGTISSVKVKVNQKVNTGDTLLTLKNTEDQARYQSLLQQRQELTELLDALTAMYQEGVIRADAAGIVSQIPADAVYETVAAKEKTPTLTLTAATQSGYQFTFLSSVTEPSSTPESSATLEGTEPSGPVMPPQEEPAAHPDGVFAGQVSKVTYGALYIKISQTDMTGTEISALESMDAALFAVEKQYAPALDIPVNQYQEGQSVSGTVGALQAGDKVLLFVEGGELIRIDYIVGTPAAPGGSGQMPSGGAQFPSGGGAQMPSGGGVQMPSGGSGYGNGQSGIQEEEEEKVYEVEKTTLCAITPAQTMRVEVRVDELDILQLKLGQEAAVTLSALPGQSFTGTVKKINTTGNNEGGSTKYTVTVELQRTEQMLDGMNAAVQIQVSKRTDVLTVPAQAICEDGTRTYVYTAVDSSGEPAKPVDVTTGAGDGSHVEILSGLSDGETVYYQYAETVVYEK